ncbi:hypothetical protein [Evansella tamaricis]|nr:hypothetical protein [Evansella tamaricis]
MNVIHGAFLYKLMADGRTGRPNIGHATGRGVLPPRWTDRTS